MRYDLGRLASIEIDDIITYTTENFGEEQAREYVSGLMNSFDLLADNPRLGKSWGVEKRRYIYRSHYIFYRLKNERPFITDIRNMRQALPNEWETL